MYCIVGANGFLGSYIQKIILENTQDNLLCVDMNEEKDQPRISHKRCDITDDSQVDELIKLLNDYDDLKIVYLAAYHNPDLVEQNKELAWHINVECLEKFIRKLNKFKAFYYPSTDSVYGESNDFYHFKEDDVLNPVNYYGQNKVRAEQIVVQYGGKVVRYPFLISPSLADKPHFYDRIVEALKNNQTFEMYEDSYRSSLSFENAARLLIKLIETDNSHPIVNVCGDKDLSKYDVGKIIANKEGLNPDLIVPITMDKAVDGFTTKRATSTLMDNSLLKNILNLEFVDIFDKPKYK